MMILFYILLSMITKFRVKVLKDRSVEVIDYTKYSDLERREIYVIHSKIIGALFRKRGLGAYSLFNSLPLKWLPALIILDQNYFEEIGMTDEEIDLIIGHEIGHIRLFKSISTDVRKRAIHDDNIAYNIFLCEEIIADKMGMLNHPSNTILTMFEKLIQYCKKEELMTDTIQHMVKCRIEQAEILIEKLKSAKSKDEERAIIFASIANDIKKLEKYVF